MEGTLPEIEVLFLDIQATHPNRGYMFEIGWWFAPADSLKDVTIETAVDRVNDYLICPPSGETLPSPIKRITGIDDEEILKGVRVSRVKKVLQKELRPRLAGQPGPTFPTIIHYGRYEIPLLEKLYKKPLGARGFPFEVICTHKIIRRLLPDLPRKGIRASAGYFGIHLPEVKRSGWHVAATAKIWLHLIQLLREREGIESLDQLRMWLKQPPERKPRKRSEGRIYPMAESDRANIPDKPGVYRMLRKNGDLLYIGKATSLKQRLNSYFQKGAKHSERLLEMLSQAQQLDFTVTANALEAALRESDEIKEKSPIYNRALRGENRETVFFSRDLTEFSPTHRPDYPIGPIPTVSSLTPFTMIHRYIEEGFPEKIDPEQLEKLFQLSPPYIPEAEMCRHAFHLFYTQHESILSTYPPLFALIKLGKQQWLKRLEELAAQKEEQPLVEDEPEDGEKTEGMEWTWTPEQIVRTFERLIRQGTFLMRRARWFTLLCESALGWQDQDKTWHVMVMLAGEISESKNLSGSKSLPVPPGHNKTWSDRQQQLNYSTYERLRVLTTELKRMLAVSPSIQIRLTPHITLNAAQLGELMRWL